MFYRVEIFVEGKSDRKFFEDYIKFLSLEGIKITALLGKGEVKNIALATLERNKEKGIKNVVIVDADLSKDDSLSLLQTYANFHFFDDYFFSPNNNEPGALELILENCMLLSKREKFDKCWSSYETCLTFNDTNFRGPFPKSKIYAYLEAVSPASHSKFRGIEKVDFCDSDNWDLGVNYLQPLKDFLIRL